MIQAINRLLQANPFTRRIKRAMVRRIKRVLGSPDAWDDMNALLSRLKPAAILDIGSHNGKTIDRFLENNRLSIHGFEPTPDSFTVLQKRFRNQPLVQLHRVALSDRTGKQRLFANRNEQTNSLLDNDSGNTQAFPEYTEHTGSFEIDAIRLDDWVASNCPGSQLLVKSDVQGAEGLLIRGGMQTFREQVLAFYSEAQLAPMYRNQIDFFELNRILTKELGFVLHNVYPCLQDRHGRALQTDAMWIHERALS